MLSKEAKGLESGLLVRYRGGVGGVGFFCHRWLTFWVEEGSLYYHFCVFVKAKKIFFVVLFFLKEVRVWSLRPVPHFQIRVPSGLRFPGCCVLLGQVLVLQPQWPWHSTPECPGGHGGSWQRRHPPSPQGSRAAAALRPDSTGPTPLPGLLPDRHGATGRLGPAAAPRG